MEKKLFQAALSYAHQAMEHFFETQGDGDLGEEIELSSGKKLRRLLEKRSRNYNSILGTFKLERYVYAKYEGQKLECIPFDARLELPESEYSYVLQDWSQTISTEVPFRKTVGMLYKMLNIKTTVDSLERINSSKSSHVEQFRISQDKAPRALKGELLVHSADGKGVPIKHKSDAKKIYECTKKSGPKPDRKRMAVVGAVYTIKPNKRTAEDIIKALFRDPQDIDDKKKVIRPKPQCKRVIANLTREEEGKEKNATKETFAWIEKEVRQRDPTRKVPHIALMDGQKSLWKENTRQFGKGDCVEILDLLHGTSYLWDIANVLIQNTEKEHKKKRINFMKEKVLQGKVKTVIRSSRHLATSKKFSAKKREKLDKACDYLSNNAHRMKYDEYLELGYPVASGVIEGACRHYVKDRMERAGMHWSISGAQAMLNVRSVYLNGDWEEFVKNRIEHETKRLYPYKRLIEKANWPLNI